MALSAGTKPGPYEILVPIGAGGMGEVYGARDTRLARDIALKILPNAFASDPDRVRRFELEGRAAAAFSHPNIVVIYDAGSEGGVCYVATECWRERRCASGSLVPRSACPQGH
jgi:eukaryotic-like serine/threonine-protein kinase